MVTNVLVTTGESWHSAGFGFRHQLLHLPTDGHNRLCTGVNCRTRGVGTPCGHCVIPLPTRNEGLTALKLIMFLTPKSPKPSYSKVVTKH